MSRSESGSVKNNQRQSKYEWLGMRNVDKLDKKKLLVYYNTIQYKRVYVLLEIDLYD